MYETVKTSIGIGMVVATIIPQHENEDVIAEGLAILKQWNPGWLPKYSMTDKSTVELNAIDKVFPSITHLLCDFHRAQAWERWVSKGTNDVLQQNKSVVLGFLKKLAYVPTGKSFCFHTIIYIYC